MKIAVVGAGLAGSELSYQLSTMGYQVDLFEGKKIQKTPAQKSDRIGELVCSNSFKSEDEWSASGQLKWEMEKLNSLFLRCGKKSKIPGGSALVVDRGLFSDNLSKELEGQKNIKIIDKVVDSVDQLKEYGKIIIATGPLTLELLHNDIQKLIGEKNLAFFDAISPVVDADSINYEKVFKANRYDKGEEDAYLNCPFSKQEYENFIDVLEKAERVEFESFEKDTPYFQACQPIEKILDGGRESLRFGPMKPVGLIDPVTGNRPHAVVQLRLENKEGTSYNIVGFQTKLKYGEQKKVFQLIPGLENAEFYRFGSLHRNTYLNSPKVLDDSLCFQDKIFFAGQILGVEGYVESAATGLLVAHILRANIEGKQFVPPPPQTAIGSLYGFLRAETKSFQPMNINFGVFPRLSDNFSNKSEKYKLIVERARESFNDWFSLIQKSF